MIAAASLTGMDGKNAFRIWRRDRRNHASPNSAQTEAVMAGALNVRLAGDTQYFGVLHKKPYIGDDIRPIEAVDILRSHRLLRITAWLMLLITLAGRCLLHAAL
jgi:adenosylcobinamide-phosphate synthase